MDDRDDPAELRTLDSAHDVGRTVAQRAAQPPFSELSRQARAARRRTAVLSAAAVAVAIAAGGVLVRQVADAPTPPVASPAPKLSDPPGTVAWAALPPTHPTIARHTMPAQPDPALARAVPACTADALAASASLDGAGGHWVLSVVFHNTEAQPCHLDGTPTWWFRVGNNTVNVPQAAGDRGGYDGPVLVAGGRQAVAWGMWSTTECSASEPATVLVTAPGTTTALEAGKVKASPVCSGAATHAQMGVSTVSPENGWRPAHQASDWEGTQVRIEPPIEVTAGQVAQYVVDVTAPRDISLDTCPDYVVHMTALGSATSTQQAFGLNCAAVPFSSASGDPQLPADVMVSFAMRVPIPEDLAGKKVKFAWDLTVPEAVIAAVPLTVS